MGFYLHEKFLGRTAGEAVGKLTKAQRRDVCYDYVVEGLTPEEAAELIVISGVPEPEELTVDALDYIREGVERWHDSPTFGGVWFSPEPKPQQSKSIKKTQAKKTSKPKASTARAPSRSASRRY